MDPIKNLVYNELTNTPYTSGDTSITVSDGSVFSDPSTDGNFEAVIYNKRKHPGLALNDGEAEIVLVTAISTNTLTVTRAQGGTSAIALGSSIDWAIVQGATKRIFDQYLVDEDLLDEDDMSSDSATKGATQQSIKAYVDNLDVAYSVAVSDEDSDLETGTGKVTFRMPYAMTLTDVRASVTTAPTGSALTVDINESGSTILSTKLTIDAGEKTSTTAATAAVISDSDLADDAEMTIDIDAVGSTVSGTGLKVTLIGTRA